jgi:hypothetical protein
MVAHARSSGGFGVHSPACDALLKSNLFEGTISDGHTPLLVKLQQFDCNGARIFINVIKIKIRLCRIVEMLRRHWTTVQ